MVRHIIMSDSGHFDEYFEAYIEKADRPILLDHISLLRYVQKADGPILLDHILLR